MASARVFVKKQVRIDHLTFRQQAMFKIGTVGLASVKNRLAAAQGPTDGAAKPLTKRYAIWKNKQGKGNRRNLMLTGDMLRSFQIRTASENKSRAGFSGRSGSTIGSKVRNKRGKLVGVENKLKAWVTNKVEPWIVFSSRNKHETIESAKRVLTDMARRLILEKAIGSGR